MANNLMQQVLFEKTAIAVQDLADGAGYLMPVPARRFLRIGLPATSILKMARLHPMSSPEEHLDKFRWHVRVLRAGTSATALSEVEKPKPQLTKRVLQARLVKAQIDLPIETLEDNIEKQGFMQTLFDGLAPRVGLDWEELLVNGDVDNAVDAYLALFDGIYKQASSIIYNHLGGPVSLDLWTKMVKLMPPEFQSSLLGGAKFFTPFNLQHDWRANLAGRVGPVGDSNLQTLKEVGAFGIPIEPVVNVRDDVSYNGLANHADILLTNPAANIVVGLYGGLRLFMDLNVETGVWKIVLRFRTDAKLIEQTAAVKGRNVLIGATSQRVGGSSTARLLPDNPAALSVLGFTTPENDAEGFDDGITSFVPPANLGITAPVKFTP
jgi:hypothetical protein